MRSISKNELHATDLKNTNLSQESQKLYQIITNNKRIQLRLQNVKSNPNFVQNQCFANGFHFSDYSHNFDVKEEDVTSIESIDLILLEKFKEKVAVGWEMKQTKEPMNIDLFTTYESFEFGSNYFYSCINHLLRDWLRRKIPNFTQHLRRRLQEQKTTNSNFLWCQIKEEHSKIFATAPLFKKAMKALVSGESKRLHCENRLLYMAQERSFQLSSLILKQLLTADLDFVECVKVLLKKYELQDLITSISKLYESLVMKDALQIAITTISKKKAQQVHFAGEKRENTPTNFLKELDFKTALYKKIKVE